MDPDNKSRQPYLIGRLPTDLFQVIQSFLSHEDYRNLMNCNNTIFGKIKYETVVYHIYPTNYHRLERKESEDLQVDERIYYNLINEKVKDKSKQIRIDMRNLSSTVMFPLASSFQGIKELILWNIEGLNDQFDFNMFNNIHTVSLANFEGITSISSGFENVKMLTILRFRELLSITNINMTKTLQAFNIYRCNKLMILNFPLNNIFRLKLEQTIHSNFNLQTITNSKLKEFSFEYENPIQTILFNPIDFSSLWKLSLSCYFPENFHDFNLFENIADLRLSSINSEAMATSSISLTRFHGQYLSLTNFKVFDLIQNMLQDNKSFSNLKKLDLTHCHDFTDIPYLPVLQRLSLTNCKEVKSIPNFQTIECLQIHKCNKLRFIPMDQPKLKECCFTLTSNNDFSFASKCKSLYFSFNDEVKDVSKLNQVKELDISHCKGLTSVDGLSGDPLALQPDQRTIYLSTLYNVRDLSLHHIYSLRLVGLPHLHSCEGIHHIEHLQIHNCDNFVTTSGLKNITRALDISYCLRFDSLVDVEGIPLIRLKENERLVDYSSIQDHWTDCGQMDKGIRLFALNSMKEEMKGPEWRKMIKTLLK